ncbi:trihelix transcription factor GTL1 isoform X2 [Humulus lupulus]|uniref:trihelix transcription factor GTL1 isoform X2 n=1 Tax=Humulus lupulus TaxID=3486 RepID=UPI002B406EF7|nr:trihelix transcription factor GTL1 isoform X2 [Humulus lupulus]
MQHGLEVGGGGGGGGVSSTEDTGGGGTGESMEQGGQQLPVEAASPISSRPPAASSVNLDEYMAMSSGGGGGGGGNRWPRQETLALLRIRSEMDTVFRDASLKGPLWEDVSRKLAELGYNRSGKKCKEKFENVHKYYKRTKEGRAGRQDGKTYKFFTELEALHATTAIATATATAAPQPPHHLPPPPSLGVGISNPMPISSFPANINITPPTYSTMPPTSTPAPPPSQQPITAAPVAAISFSSNSSSSSPGSEDDEDDDDDDVFEGGPSNPAVVGSSRKRKRDWSSRHGASTMEFFENLMKQVMQKQEAMQQRFLEVIEKREQDRMIRDEAWKRQEMARLSREHELMAQERTISASRDAAIISFLQKITGQTIHLPDPPPPPPPLNTTTGINPNVTIHVPTPTVPPPAPAPVVAAAVPPVITQQHHDQQQLVIERRQSPSADRYQTPSRSISQQPQQQQPQQQQQDQTFTGGAASSRWPKPEVLALIKLRSGLESKYQEAGPKGPLWEEISAEMQRMGYKRSPKRCKEKWENINKYFKKVKESNKQRPEDAKTCPYFHELDALYRKKIIGSGSITPAAQLPQPQPPQEPQSDFRRATVAAVDNQAPKTAQPAAAANIGTENKSSVAATSGFGQATGKKTL